jgi:uncharacterized protein (TIGR02246 family)
MTDGSIERACERLVFDFAYFSDRQDYESLVSLFTPDGTMVRPSGAPLTGRSAILESYRSRPAERVTRHICTNVRVTVESPDRARGLTYALLYTANAKEPAEGHLGLKADASHLVGEFDDEFVRTDDGWRIASRRARFVMHS